MSKADNLTNLHSSIVLKSWRLNLLEPSGPVQDCNGIALPLPLPLHRALCEEQDAARLYGRNTDALYEVKLRIQFGIQL